MRPNIRGLVCGTPAATLTLAVTGSAFADAATPKLNMMFSSSSATLVAPLYVAQLGPLVHR